MDTGDIVVIVSSWTPRNKRIDWLSCMDPLVGLTGIITRRYPIDKYAGIDKDAICWQVRTYHEAERSMLPDEREGFIYYVEHLRPATEEEKQAFQLIHLVRKP